MPFTFHPQSISDVILIQPRVFPDDRGLFLETYKQSEFAAAGITTRFVQDNHSRSTRGVVRGLHYQVAPAAQAKLIRVVRGCVWDVAVDIRSASPTFGRWVATELSEDNHHLLYIPEGFAHGFAVLSDMADLEYKVSCEYSPEHERGIAWDDPELAIDWPVDNPIISRRDADLPGLHLLRQGPPPPHRLSVSHSNC